MKPSPIKLHHFGEPLVASIIKGLGTDIFFKFLKSSAFYPDNTSEEEKIKKIKLISGAFKSGTEVNTHIDLISELGYKFDSEHTIDVALLKKNTMEILPIEIKMGTSGSVDSWGSFRRYIKKGIKPRELKKKGESINYLDGNMSSILARYPKNPGEDFKISAQSEGVTYNWQDWCLCIREEKREDFENKKSRPDDKHLPLIFTFESLVQYFNEQTKEGIRNNHKDLIKIILDSSDGELEVEIQKGLKLVSIKK